MLQNTKALPEIEKKFSIDKKDLEQLKNKSYEKWIIWQGYFEKDGEFLRIRSIKSLGKANKYFLNNKVTGTDGIVMEKEMEISKIDFLKYQKLCSVKIVKDRYLFKEIGYTQVFELDVFPGLNLCFVEVEFDNLVEMNNFKKPSWIVGELDRKEYSNFKLACKSKNG